MCTDRTAHSTGAALAGPGVSLTLNTLAEELLRNIKKAYEESSKIPDDLLLALKFLFGSLALQALDLVDQCSVTCLSSPSGRKVFQVLGGSGKLYSCLASCHYCPCPAFAFSVLRKNNSLLCKHILAVHLCQAMGLTQQESVSDRQMSDVLSGLGNGT
ncbi:zinc finger SWIM domain-containing protein 7 isoform X1 [Paramormyrops kingsleyae]|uniref:zinc finger SWIM domain-containing protein 7 isoform X1 n=1 Tax=Paramormyrops kingsleyae TaxID=1676925 RepID=UPI000CD6708B|nr:zinc finger SWIM domain-containing protein 7 isoform X1 [Paramormyrops kingsleyae]